MKNTGMALMVLLTLLLAACGGAEISSHHVCQCVGKVPEGQLNIGCGQKQCLANVGYRCTTADTPVADQTACTDDPSDDDTDAGNNGDAPPDMLAADPNALGEHASCFVNGAQLTCDAPFVCLLDSTSAPTAGACKKTCNSNGDCPSSETCVFGILDGTGGLCAVKRTSGQTCDEPWAGKHNCGMETGSTALPNCANGTCQLICEYSNQDYTCPSSQMCVASTVAGIKLCTDGSTTGPMTGACEGTATTQGTVDSVTPKDKVSQAKSDASSGGIDLILTPNASVVSSDVVTELIFLPTMGQSSYANSASGGCAILTSTGSGWSVVDKTQLCDLELTQLTLASTAGTCDGQITGSFTAVMSGNQTFAGTFSVPTNIAWSQIAHLSCQPTDGPCSKNSDCCDASCSMYIGVCN